MAWMNWTLPTAIFFIVIATLLLTMTSWQLISPSIKRKGFLPLATHRGDRFFIALISSGYIHLIYLFLLDATLWYALGMSVILSLVILWKG